MARGWESKGVEAQQEERARGGDRPAVMTDEEKQRVARLRTLQLTRARAVHDLATARTPAHRAMLEAALKALDDQLTSASRVPAPDERP